MLWTCASLLIRSGLILGAAELLRRAACRSTAALRHRIVLAGFALLLVWPLCSVLIPEVRVPLWKTKPVIGQVVVRQTVLRVGQRNPQWKDVNWPLLIWLAGVAFSAAPVLIGNFKVRRLARRAAPLVGDTWPRLIREECDRLRIATEPEIRVSDRQVVPFVFGWYRSRIVLPAAWLEWPDLRQRTVILHELAHVKRRDVSWQLLANAISILWWFQPFCWYMRSALRRESERACDALVLSSGIRASDYASDLLAIAQTFNGDQAWSSAAIAMARRGELEGRLYAILDARPGSARKLPLYAGVIALGAMTLMASTITLLPEQGKITGGSQMKKTVFAGLLASAGLSAATIGGSVFDPNGAAIPNAQVSLYNPDTSAKQETTTASDGKFAFESLGAGSYMLRLDKPGFSPLYRAFNVQADSDVERGLVLKVAANDNKPGQTAVPQPLDPKVLRVGGELAENNLTRKVQPIYPAAAKEAHIQGTVQLEVTISKQGVPEDLRVLSSPSDDLTQSALDAVRQWRYKPMLLNGEPVEIVTDVIVNYTLSS